MAATPSLSTRLDALLRGVPAAAEPWIRRRPGLAIVEPLALIAVCGGIYGASIGAWRAVEQALACAVKLPLLLCATALICAVLNALWARRLGLDLSLGECLSAVLLSFALAAVVLAAFAPVLLFFDSVLPGPWSGDAWLAHNLLGLAHVAAIAAAGTIALTRQQAWLAERCPSAPSAPGIAVLWLAIHLVVGAQLSWNLRPWFGSPGLPVEFLREDPFDGTFYESLFHMTRRLAH